MSRVIELAPETAAAFERMGATNMRFGMLETEREAPPVTETVAVTEAELMSDEEAFRVLRRISAVQSELADIEANAKTMKTQAVTDLKDYLGNFDRLARLEAWHASKLTGKRRSVTVLTGSIGKKTVAAKCIVADKGLALEWLRENAPEAIEPKIIAAKLPAPVSGYDERGEIEWKSPAPGLRAVPEHEEITINGKQLSTLLKGGTEGANDDE